MVAAQVKAWLAVHEGSVDEVSCIVDATLADAALARMMLHRRRATLARVVEEFFEQVGGRFSPYLGGRAPQAPVRAVDEIAVARAAGNIAESVGGAAPPLLFERAMIAVAEGRFADARDDFDVVLDDYPGYLAAAIEAARLAMALNDPSQAVRCLLCLEIELTNTREGAAIFADALHSIGLHEAAGSYDLAALICPGYFDSRGNDCAPVDMKGGIVVDHRMPPAFRIKTLEDGRVLCNDRGIYYLGSTAINNLAGGLISSTSWPPKIARAEVRTEGFLTRFAPVAFAEPINKFGRFITRRRLALDHAIQSGFRVYKRMPMRVRYGLNVLVAPPLALRRKLSVMAGDPESRRAVYRGYKQLPKAVRFCFNILFLVPLFRQVGEVWREIPECNRRSKIIQERLEHGIARILRSKTKPMATHSEDRQVIATDDRESPGAIAAPSAMSNDDDVTPSRSSFSERPAIAGDISPRATEVIDRLMSDSRSLRS